MDNLELEIIKALRQLTKEKMVSFEPEDREGFLSGFDDISRHINSDDLQLSRVTFSVINPSDLTEPGYKVEFELTPRKEKPKLRLVS